jgi:hypothetical protein
MGRMNVAVGWAVLLIPAALVASPAAGVTYHASPSGKGRECSAAVPCSLARCVARIKANGDVCSLGDGIYTDPEGPAAYRNCGPGAGVCTIRAATPPADIRDNTTYRARVDLTSEGDAWLTVRGDNWVVDGILFRVQAQRRVVHVTADNGFTFTNNRAEVMPGVGPEFLMIEGTDNVVVRKNWAHHYPGCINFGQSYPAGPWGAGRTATGCEKPNGHCDFDNSNGDLFLFNGDGTKTATSGLTFEQNDYGHWQNPARIHNYVNVQWNRNKATNCTNHGCVEADDVQFMVMENNIGDADLDPNCADDPCNSALFDTYCASHVILRNNTVVGHGFWWEQQLDALEPNPGADKHCNDDVLPEIGDAAPGQWYKHVQVYNNIVYDGDPGSGAAGILMNMPFRANPETAPVSISDYNLIHKPAGKAFGIDNNIFYRTFPAWQAGAGSTAHDAHGTQAAPQFVQYCNTKGSTACGDYRPAGASAPQVDAGVNSETLPCPAVDYDGLPRMVGGACDIGAFEYRGEAPARSSPAGAARLVTSPSLCRYLE